LLKNEEVGMAFYERKKLLLPVMTAKVKIEELVLLMTKDMGVAHT